MWPRHPNHFIVGIDANLEHSDAILHCCLAEGTLQTIVEVAANHLAHISQSTERLGSRLARCLLDLEAQGLTVHRHDDGIFTI